MDIIGLQLDMVWEDKEANVEQVRTLLNQSPPEPGGMIVLPEMFATGFSMDVTKIAEPPNGGGTALFLAGLAKQYQAFVIGGVVTAGEEGKGRNEALLFDPAGRELGRYCKMHPFSFAGENNYYIPGERPIVVSCGDFSVVPFICYDLRFPEIFRSAPARNAEVFVVLANWPAVRAEHWTALLKARAIENQAFVVGINRRGADPNIAYAGQSMIFHPDGRCLAVADESSPFIRATLNRAELLATRRSFPVLSDRKM